jgi:acyl-CoA thioesterase-2
MNPVEVPPWNGEDLVELLTLEALAPMRFRSRCGDRNAHDRVYGGQVLAQALMAAARTVPAGRAPTAMQLLFLQGARHHDAIGFDVTALQGTASTP